MATPIDLTAEPVDDTRCKFVLSRPVAAPGVQKYTSQDETDRSPVAQAVLGVPGVSEVVISGNLITVTRTDTSMPWSVLEPQVRYAVNAGAARQEQLAGDETIQALGDDEIYRLAVEIFEKQINPAVASHGGMIELIDVQDATVMVRLMGGCQGCGMAAVTLRQGVEAALKRAIPAIKGVRDITDHSSGANPYYSPGAR